MNKKRIEYRERNKEQIAKVTKIYKLNHPWLTTLSNIQQRCTNPKFPKFEYYGGKGIKCLITSDELKELWFRDKAYLMNKSSIDRKNSKKNYTFDNCQFIELNINCCKESKKLVLQFDLQNNFIREFKSVTEAGKKLNIHKTGISACCRGKQKTSIGYIWKYKEIKC